jgi:hypothetical protein
LGATGNETRGAPRSPQPLHARVREDTLVLVKKDPLQVRMAAAERVRELAQQVFFLEEPDAPYLVVFLFP